MKKGGSLGIKPQAVLIIGFRRSKNIAAILELAKLSNSSRIYLALDGPRNQDEKIETDLCRKVALQFQNANPGMLRIKDSSTNLGCAVSVLSACDWVFSLEDFAIVIEDDCIPSLGFFDYVEDARSYLISSPSTLLICGTRFTPTSLTDGKWWLSSYPLIWGWATSSIKWLELRDLILGNGLIAFKESNLKRSELSFWKSGARRALSGFVDAWDIPMVYGMRLNGATAILPGTNLVKNLGDDQYATHTTNPTNWIGIDIEDYVRDENPPIYKLELNDWLRHNFYRIRGRHNISTKLTWIMDKVGVNSRAKSPLRDRWK